MNKLVSIIVPVYNCEVYIRGCISSILNQSYANIELLLVDDASTDRSGEICEEYTDARVRVFRRPDYGVSCTRNYGIQQAKGDYLMFVDSDDTIEPDMVEVLVNALEENNADCSLCGLFHDYADHSRIFPEKVIQKCCDGKEAIAEILKNYLVIAGPVCKLFRKELIQGKGFPEELTVGEDAVAVIDFLEKCNVAVFHTRPLYHYNHRGESLTSSSFSKRDMDLIYAYERIDTMLQGKGLETECQFRKIWSHFHVWDKAVNAGETKNEQAQEILHWLRAHRKEIWNNPYVGRNRKIASLALLIHKRLYYFFLRLKG